MLIRLLGGITLALSLTSGPVAADTLSICAREDVAPFSSRTDDGTFTGYTVDMCREVAQYLGYDGVKIVPVTSEDRFDALDAGKCRLLCASTTINRKRRAKLEFSPIIFVTDTAFLFPRGLLSEIPKEMSTLKIGYVPETTTHEHIDAGRIFGGAELKLEPIQIENHALAAEALLKGEISGYVTDREILEGILDENPPLKDTYIIGSRGLTYEPYALALRFNDIAMRRDVDDALADMFEDGTVFRLLEEHIPRRRYDPIIEALFKIQAIPE